MEFVEHWRWRERPFEPTWDKRFFVQDHDPDAASHRLKCSPGATGQTLVPTPCEPRELKHESKLTLEFAEQPGYPETTVTGVDVVVRDLKCLQTLAIA